MINNRGMSMNIYTKQNIWCSTEANLNTKEIKNSFNQYLSILFNTKNLIEKLPLLLPTLVSPFNTVGAQAYLTFIVSFFYTFKNEVLTHNLEHYKYEFGDFHLESIYDFYTLHRDYLTSHNLYKDISEQFRALLKKNSIHGNIIVSITERIKKNFRNNFEVTISQNKELALFLYYYLFREDLEGVNLNDNDLTNINFDHAHLIGANFSKSLLSNANLSSANLSSAILEETNLENAELHLTIAQKANMRNANLKCAVFVGANLSFCNFEGANLSSANFQNVTMHGANLKKSKIEYANFEGANLAHCIFDESEIHACDFENANLFGVKFSKASFDTINLKNAILQQADFHGKNLCGMNFSGMNLQGTILSECDLEGINFDNADLRGAFFADANLRNVSLYGANLYNADFFNVNLQNAYLYFAILTNLKRVSIDAIKTARNWDKAFYDIAFEENLGLKGVKRFDRDDLKLVEKVASIKEVKKEYAEYLKQRIDWDKK